MKVNKKQFLIRLITFPIKLLFNLIWFTFLGFITSLMWLVNGSQELYYGKDHGKSLVNLIDGNKELLDEIKAYRKDIDKSVSNSINK